MRFSVSEHEKNTSIINIENIILIIIAQLDYITAKYIFENLYWNTIKGAILYLNFKMDKIIIIHILFINHIIPIPENNSPPTMKIKWKYDFQNLLLIITSYLLPFFK